MADSVTVNFYSCVYAIGNLHFRDVASGLQRSSGAFNVIRRTAARARARAPQRASQRVKSLRLPRASRAPSFLRVSAKQPGANRSDRLECTELPGPPGENSTLYDLDAVSFVERSGTKRRATDDEQVFNSSNLTAPRS